MVGGEKPTLLCNKLRSKFFQGHNYIEVDIDIASQKIAKSVTGVVLPKLTKTIVSHAFLLEGQSEDELPERVLGLCRTQKPDMIKNTVVL